MIGVEGFGVVSNDVVGRGVVWSGLNPLDFE